MNNAETGGDERGELFTRLMMSERKRIFRFIYSLVHDRHSSEDVLQDVSVVLWKKFDSFEIGTDFGAWAMCVARFTVLNWRRRQKKLPIALSDDTLQLIADDAVAKLSTESSNRSVNLTECIHKLSDRQRSLLRARYELDQDVDAIAKKENRTARSIYFRLEKVHCLLLECLNRKSWRIRAENKANP